MKKSRSSSSLPPPYSPSVPSEVSEWVKYADFYAYPQEWETFSSSPPMSRREWRILSPKSRWEIYDRLGLVKNTTSLFPLNSSLTEIMSSSIVDEILDPEIMSKEVTDFHSYLTDHVIGQGDAVEAVTRIYQNYLAGLAPKGRPIGNLLFLGPTGTGKTRLVEATAEAIFGNPGALLKIDCAEFQHSHEIAKLIGSPPGYLGHKETHPILSAAALAAHYTGTIKISLVLFDEIEKASDSLWNLLLGILDKGTLTLGDNTRVDFSRSIIFLTSNLGAKEVRRLLTPGIGFGAAETERIIRERGVGDDLRSSMAAVGNKAAKEKFTPEFLNRLDEIVSFSSLSKSVIRKIAEIELENLQRQLLSTVNPFMIEFSPGVIDSLIADGISVEYGARFLKRLIYRRIIFPIGRLINSSQVSRGDGIRVEIREGGVEGEIVFRRIRTNLSPAEMIGEKYATN